MTHYPTPSRVRLNLFVFFTLLFMGSASVFSQSILLVDDFHTSAFPWKPLWQDAFTTLGLSAAFTTDTEIDEPGRPGPVKLSDFDIVIWHTGLDETDTLKNTDRAAISSFLENGGRLLLTGTGAPYEMIQNGNRDWLKRYLRCDYLMRNSTIVEGSIYEYEPLVGNAGGIFEGMRFFLDHGEFDTYPVDSPNLIYEEVHPETGGGGARHCVSFENIAGHLGIQFEGPILPGAVPCRSVLLTFPLETAHPASKRIELLDRILKFFQKPDQVYHTITGTVESDETTPSPLPQTLVSLEGTSFRTLSKPDGSFLLTGVTPGVYKLKARLFRYDPLEVRELCVPGSNSLVLRLKPSAVPLIEGRAVWVVRNQMTSPQNIERVVTRCADAGFNALFVQVRGSGDAYYMSKTEPRASALSSQPPDFDPLGYVLEKAHDRGLQVHAWLNTFYVYPGASTPSSPKHVLNRHPEWVLTNRAGRPLSDYTSQEISDHYSEGIYLSPSIPACRDYLADVFLEIVEKYDVDGVHFDFVRYPFRGNRIDSDWDLGYSPLAREAFQKQHGIDPLDILPTDTTLVRIWNDWRRDSVGLLVRDVHSRARSLKPTLRVSAAVFERYHLGRVQAFQDWIDWMQKDWIDTCCIMAYNADNDLVSQRIRLGVENQGRGTIWAGLGAGTNPYSAVLERTEQVRRYLPGGIQFFSYASFSDSELKDLHDGPFTPPAVITRMPGFNEWIVR